MKMHRDDSALLIVDFQDRLLPAAFAPDALLKKAVTLVAGCAALGVPVMVTRQYPKGLGDTVPEIKELIPDAPVYDKLSFDACGEKEIADAVLALGRKNIMVCGIESHVCVLQTAIGLAELGLHPVFVEDCAGSRSPEDKRIALERAKEEGCTLATAESALFELLRGASEKEFKTISKLVK